jgi:hypothetical protein
MKFDKDKKTAGQIIAEHHAKKLELEDDVIEYRRLMEKDILYGLNKTTNNAKDHPIYANKDFYVVMTKMIDPVLKQPKIISWARRSCPTPVYKQDVWKFIRSQGRLVPLWSIPDSILYNAILANSEKYLLDRETEELAKAVILMESGELLQWVKKENGEKIDAVIKLKEMHA